jgi:signal transduction histidine kinase/CheY-like chemotaxis protein
VTRGWWTLRRKMIALLVVASTLPVAITSYLVFARGRDLLRQGAVRSLHAVADATVARLDAVHRRYFGVLALLGRMPAVQQACRDAAAGAPPAPAATATLAAALRGDERMRGLALFDDAGHVVVTTEPEYRGASLAARGYVRAALTRPGPAVDLIVPIRFAEEAPLLGYGQVFDADGVPCGVAFAIRAEVLDEQLRAISGALGRGSYAVVLDEHGIRLAHGARDDLRYRPTGPIDEDARAAMIAEARFGRRTAELLAEPVPTPTQYERARAPVLDRAAADHHHAPGNDEDNDAVARRATTAPWTVFVLVPTATTEAPIVALLRGTVPISAGVIALAFLAGLVLTERGLRPVRRLLEASRAIAAGAHHTRVVTSTADELGILAEQFNEMAAAIARSHEELEHRIKDRTQALLITNAELRNHREELVVQKEEVQAQRDELERKNAEIERADRMKSEFLANMSHELRTPLNSVIGFADLLQVTTEGRISEEERGQLRDIVAAGRHLLLIINDILDLAKIEAGQVRLSLDALDPAGVVAAAVAMVQAQARPRRIELRTAVAARRAVRADEQRLRQVLLNLLSNAIKFSPEGAAIDVCVDDAGDEVVFEVIDRGPGIPAALADQLFQPFVQGEGALVKRHQGTGLGLAICKRLVELHGGTIELASRLGHGSTFRVRLPAAGRRHDAEVAAGPAHPTILLVVAGPSNHHHRAQLEAAGYRVEPVGPEADLAAAARAAAAALVVIDVHDAGGDADAILARASGLAAERPVVLLGGDAQLLVGKPLESARLRALCSRLIADDGAPPRLLVIDDDPRVAELVAAALGEGFRVEGATTAADGLRRAAGERFDLHVVDLALPDGSGFEVLEALAGDEQTRATPRIVLTAARLDEAQLVRLRRHAQAVATKGSTTPEELLGVVDRLLHPPALAADAGAPTILVVDDHDPNRELARSILERLGYRVVQARDGAEAVAIAERTPPQLILMDLAMPGTDGFTATRQLKAHPGLRRIPVVALSALAAHADEERARAAGVDDFLTKPLDRLALERAVARLLGRG